MVLFKPMVIALALALALPALAECCQSSKNVSSPGKCSRASDSRDSNTFQSYFKKTTSATFAEEQRASAKSPVFQPIYFQWESLVLVHAVINCQLIAI